MVEKSLEEIRPESENELIRRLPEIRTLDGSVRDEVVDVFLEYVPPYFYMARSSKNHHPPDERGLGGLYLHTKRVFTAYAFVQPTYRAMSRLSAFESNCGRAAVLLHDALKYSVDPESVKESDENEHEYAGPYLDHLPYGYDAHDVEMAQLIRVETDLPEEVARAVESHGGSASWLSHAGPSPEDDLEMSVHLADMMASNEYHRLPVLEPPEEMVNPVGSDIPTIPLEAVEARE